MGSHRRYGSSRDGDAEEEEQENHPGDDDDVRNARSSSGATITTTTKPPLMSRCWLSADLFGSELRPPLTAEEAVVFSECLQRRQQGKGGASGRWVLANAALTQVTKETHHNNNSNVNHTRHHHDQLDERPSQQQQQQQKEQSAGHTTQLQLSSTGSNPTSASSSSSAPPPPATTTASSSSTSSSDYKGQALDGTLQFYKNKYESAVSDNERLQRENDALRSDLDLSRQQCARNKDNYRHLMEQTAPIQLELDAKKKDYMESQLENKRLKQEITLLRSQNHKQAEELRVSQGELARHNGQTCLPSAAEYQEAKEKAARLELENNKLKDRLGEITNQLVAAKRAASAAPPS